MPKIYVRVNPRSQISKRHRCAIEFTSVWKELDVDAATRAGLEEDPYLEVSETPTVQVEVAAATQAGAIDPYPNEFNPVIIESGQDTITPESNTQQDSADAAQGNSEQAGTASAVGGEEKTTDRGPTADESAAPATGDANSTGDNAPVVDAAANGGGTADTDVKQPAIDSDKSEIDQRIEAIKAAIAKLDPNNAEYWLKDGRPSAAALESVAGLIVTAAERDSVWASLNKGAE